LIGQPELRELLARNDLRQLAQRITGRYHLEPLTRDETAQYVEHRLRVAGALGEVIDRGAKREVYRLSQGVPRLINVICDRALLGAYSQESRIITRRLIRQAAAEVAGELEVSPYRGRYALAAILLAIAVVAASYWSLVQQQPTAVETSVAAMPAPTQSAIEPAKTPTAEVPVAVVPVPSLSEQLKLAGELTSTDFAFASLFSLWGLDYTSGARGGCAQATDAGLACLSQRGSWNGLRQLNRPAILSVIDVDGEKHDVVLVTIDGDRAELSIGGVVVSHPVAAISDVWFGQYLLLWRPPGGAAVPLLPGSRGAQVVWLRQSLASIDDRYRSANIDADNYDSELLDIVKRFQRDHRLDVDGLAGQKTQIVINALLSPDGSPRLIAPRLARN
jgi:general secretion pathway protein A